MEDKVNKPTKEPAASSICCEDDHSDNSQELTGTGNIEVVSPTDATPSVPNEVRRDDAHVQPGNSDVATGRNSARPMQKRRFLMGLVFSAAGIGLMLVVAAGAVQDAGFHGRLSLPVVGFCMIIGLMLLGGGFGVMATAAPTFDDNEFDRLVQAGESGVSEPVSMSRHQNNAWREPSRTTHSRSRETTAQ